MSDRTFLFIGGFFDGKRIEIKDGLDRVELPCSPTAIPALCSEMAKVTEPMLTTDLYYRLRLGVVELFAQHDLGLIDVMNALIDGYRKQGGVDER